MVNQRIALPPRGPSIMAVAAHPDDIESWCAGTLAGAIDAGATVRLLLVTSGDKGSSDPGADPAKVGTIREAEAREAADQLGIREVALLRIPDGETENTAELRGEIVGWIRRWRPETVFTHDPEHPLPPKTFHRDHRVVGRACLDAVYPFARDPLAFPEHCAMPHEVQEVWLFASAIAETFVDISAGFDRKIAARVAHRSQTSDPGELVKTWRTRFQQIGQPMGLLMAEAFVVLTI